MRLGRETPWGDGQLLAVTLTILVVSATVTPILGVATAQQPAPNATKATSGQPNLVVTDIAWRPAPPDAGEDMEFQLTIVNTGDVMAENVEASVRVDGELAAVPPLRDIGPGETSTTAWTGSYTVSGGAHTVEGIVDPDDHIAESDETDNSITDQFTAETSYGSVDGYVTDDSGDPVDGARVYLGSRTSTRTNSNGYYEFTEVPPGDYSVEVVMSGYESESQPVDVYESGTAEADFSLTPETFTVDLSSEPISVYTDGDGTYDFGEEVTVSAPASEDGYEFQAWETRDGEVVSRDSTFTIEYLNTDMTLVAQYAKPGKPDLTIDDISWDVTDPEEGEDVTFYVKISNDGEARAANLNLELSVGNDIFRTGNLDLEPGEEKTVQIGPWSADEGTEEVRSEIDYADEIDEEDETNNERDESFVVSNQQADLRVTDITLSPSPPTVGEDVSVSVTVTNAGDAPAENVDTKVSIQGEVLSESNIDFAAGETRRLSMGAFRLYETSGDSIDATATTDYTDEIDEEDETNNRITDAIPIDEGQPNLEVATINMDPRYPEAGDEVAFQVVVANTGEVGADYVEVAVDLGSQTVRLDEIRSIEGGETVSTEYTFGREFEGGTHTIEAFVDPDDEIDESSETDNTGEKTVSIDPETGTIEGRVLTVTGEAVEDAEIVVGGRTTVTDDDGHFRLTGLESGPAVLVVEKDDFPRYEHDISVPAGGTEEYAVELEPEEYTVDVESEPIDVDLDGEGAYRPGEDVTVAAPKTVEGYTFESWREDGAVVSTEPIYIVDGISERRELTAVYTEASEAVLEITEIDVSPSPPVAGDRASITVRVENAGEAVAEDGTVTLRVGDERFERDVDRLRDGGTATVRVDDWNPNTDADQILVDVTAVNEQTGSEVQTSRSQAISVSSGEPEVVIGDIDVLDNSYRPGETVTATVALENTGVREERLFVGYSLVGPDGRAYDNDGQTGRPVEIDPGADRTVSLRWTVPEDAPSGSYDALVILWEETARDELETRVDTEQTPNVFEVTASDTPTESPTEAPSPTERPGEETGSLVVTASRESGGALAGASVTVSGFGNTVSKTTDQDGRARFEELRAGRYIVAVEAGDTTETYRVTVEAGQSRTLDAELPAASVEFSGRIETQLDGSGVADLRVEVGEQRTTTAADGSFRFDERFAPGQYAVRAYKDGRLIHKDEIYLEGGSVSETFTLLFTREQLREGVKNYTIGYLDRKHDQVAGIVYGEYGVENPESPLLRGVDTKSLDYYGSWLASSITPVLDAPMDIRDCAVWTESDALSSVDCAGATVSVAGSVTFWTGAGLAGDVLEDVTDVVTVSLQFLKHAPNKIDEVAKVLWRIAPTSIIDGAMKKLDEIGGETANKLDDTLPNAGRVTTSTFSEAGFTESQTDVLRRLDVSKQRYALDLATKHGFTTDQVMKIVRSETQLKAAVGATKAGFDGDQVVKLIDEGRSITEALKMVNTHSVDVSTVMRMAGDKTVVSSFSRVNKGLDALDVYHTTKLGKGSAAPANDLAEALTARKIARANSARHAESLDDVEDTGRFVVTNIDRSNQEFDAVLIVDGQVQKVYETKHTTRVPDVPGEKGKMARQMREVARSDSGWAKYFDADASRADVEVVAPKDARVAETSKGSISTLDLSESQIDSLWGLLKKYGLASEA